MKPNIVLARLRAAYIKKILLPILLAGIAIILVIRSPIFNYLSPVLVNSETELDDYSGSEILYFSLTVNDLYYSGSDYFHNGKVQGNIYYTLKDGICRFYILPVTNQARIEEFIASQQINGKFLYDRHLNQSLSEQMASGLEWTLQGMEETAAGYIVSTVRLVSWNDILFYACLALVLIIAVIDFLRSLLFFLFPALSPSLQPLGSGKKKLLHLKEADRQLRKVTDKPLKGIYLTNDYLFYISFAQMKVIPTDSILWLYTNNHLHRFLWLKLSMTQILNIVTKKRRYYAWPNRQNYNAEQIITQLSERDPTLLTGYTEENKLLVQKKK